MGNNKHRNKNLKKSSNKSAEEIKDDSKVDAINVYSGDNMKKHEMVPFIEQTLMHSGPLPHPEILKGYDEILPGAAERILSMAEKQQNHRIEIEKYAIKSNSRDSLLGIIAGFVISIFGIGGGIFAIIKGFQTAGAIISAFSLGSLVSVFIYGTRSEREERKEKRE